MLKHKYIYSILQQFKFRILEAPIIDENMDTKIWIP